VEPVVHVSIAIDAICPAAVVPQATHPGEQVDLVEWLTGEPDLLLWLAEQGLFRVEVG
jgi:hypothetical protein